MKKLIQSSGIALLTCMALTTAALADSHTTSDAEITTIVVTDDIYMLTGKGGNVGVSIGEDGTFMIDDKFAENADAIMEAIKLNGGDTPKFLINTHWHPDHAGGNDVFAKQSSIIVAHDNVRKRLSGDNFIEAFNANVPAAPASALPVITFSESTNFYLNNDNIHIKHTPNAHTDGDSIIYFKESNVMHLGDVFFNGFYPFIDVAHGGSLKGMIKAADTALAMADEETKIIPGHGPLGNKANLQAYRDMLSYAFDRLLEQKAAGKSIEQAIAAKPLAELEKDWGQGLFPADKWISIVYDGLQ